jgi:anaerobic selenocysteine-containing dehydrogenase
MEDSTGVMHASDGVAEPAADTLLSEPAIVAGIAKATLAPNPRVPWDAWVADYALVRDHIAQALARDLSRLQRAARGARRLSTAARGRERQWKTPNGKANFKGFGNLVADPDMPEAATMCCG